MIPLTQTRKIIYNRKPRNSSWYVNLFVRVIGIYLTVLLRNWKMITPRGVKTTLNTWSRHSIWLINTNNVIQGQLPHHQMDLNLLKREQKITIIEIITIGKKLLSVINVPIKDILGPTFQTQRGRNTMTKKSQTSTRIWHVKNLPNKVKSEEMCSIFTGHGQWRDWRWWPQILQFGFCYVGGQNELYLRNIMLLYNQYTY